MTRGFLVRALFVAVGVASVSLVGVLAVALSQGVGDSPLGVTDPEIAEASGFTLPLMNRDLMDGDPVNDGLVDGLEFSLAEFSDRPVFLYFWASWCKPCHDEAPVIQKLWPEYRDRGYVFVAINSQDIGADAQAFVERYGLTFPVVRDTDNQVYLDYGVYGMPEAFFLKPGLDVVAKYNGALDEDDLRELLARLEEPS